MNPLNENQKLFLWLGILAVVAMGIYPPWKFVNETPTSFAFLYAPPPGQVQLDYSRLLVEWSLAGIVTAGLIATAQTASAKIKTASSTASTKTSSAQEPPKVTPSKSSSKTASTGATKSVKFPETSLGEILVESADDPDYWEGIGEARGTVKIPVGSNVQLEVRKEKPMHLAGLKELDPHALQSIDFSESEVEDDDIQYLLHFSKLHEVDLSYTSISDEGIEQLAKLNSLKRIWLDNTKVTDAALEKLKALQGLTKISLTGTDIAESSIREVKDAFPKNCEIIMASGIPA